MQNPQADIQIVEGLNVLRYEVKLGYQIHVNHNQLHSYRPVLGHGTRLPGIRWNHARERRAFTRHMCSASREGVTQQADLSAGFNLQTAVNLACCAFESYLDPPVEDQSLWQVHTSANGVKTTYVERRFLTDSFDGLVSVEVMSASDLPERDTLGGSNPYAVVSIGESSGRTETVAWGAEPTFNEKFYLFVRSPEKDVLVVRMFDEDPAKSDDSLGAAMLPVRSLLDGKHHDLEMELRGDGGGGKLKLSARFLRFEGDLSESLSDYDEEDLESIAAVSSPLDDVGDVLEQQMASLAAFSTPSMPLPWRALAKMAGQSAEDMSKPIAFVEDPTTDTQAWVYRELQQKRVIVAFRGTEQVKWKDLLTDLNFQPVSFNAERTDAMRPLTLRLFDQASKSLQVHKGFLDAYDSIRTRIFSIVDAVTERDAQWSIACTGHSLGGALATLCAYELATRRPAKSGRDPKVEMYNFGSPRVGNRAFADAYNAVVSESWRITSSRDAIPTVPRLAGYKHVENTVILTGTGLNFENTPRDLWEGRVMREVVEEISEKVSRNQQPIQEIADEVLANEKELLDLVLDGSGLEQHMEDCYLACLEGCVKRMV